jgi:iron(III) transport system ATP-binding protein
MFETPILQLRDVVKQFAQGAAPAVNRISLTLYAGEILGLLGPSGCGKTTLLRLIAGFEPLQSGSIDLAGTRVAGEGDWQPPEQRHVGMVFQDYALFPHLTVQQNVAFGLQSSRQKRFSRKQIRTATQDAIALVGLSALAHRYPHELSGGQQQRVALARAIAPQPALVLLDEPLSNLDLQVRLHLRQEVRSILKLAGTTAVFVTHDQEEALSMCDRVGVMNHGYLEQIDIPEVLYQHPRSRFVAEFVTQANFLRAERQGEGWLTEIGLLHLPTMPGRSVTVIVRPEDIELELDDRSKILIRDRQFLGREYRYWLTTPADRPLYARCSTNIHLPVGASVRVSVPTHKLQAFAMDETANQADVSLHFSQR